MIIFYNRVDRFGGSGYAYFFYQYFNLVAMTFMSMKHVPIITKSLVKCPPFKRRNYRKNKPSWYSGWKSTKN